MDAVYRVKREDFNVDFLNKVKPLFLAKELAVTIEEVQDTTEYLLSSEANREFLLQGIENRKQGRHGPIMTFEEMEAMIK